MKTIERLIVGVDFSDPSIAAVRWVAENVRPSHELVLVHVLEVPQPPDFLRGLLPSRNDLVERLRADAEEQLAALAAAIGGAVRTKVATGRAADELLRAAEEADASIVVAGEHAPGHGLQRFLGSTAEHMIREGERPVLLARGLPPGAPRRILAPVDESRHAREVLAWAGTLAERWGARITVFHALGLMYYGHLRIVSSEDKAREVDARMRDEARRWLKELVRGAGLDADIECSPDAAGDPALEIVGAADRHDADFIIMGSRGTGAVTQAFLGSVARGVLRSARGPVLVVSAAD